jgi:ketosteroid isomerase-like protein
MRTSLGIVILLLTSVALSGGCAGMPKPAAAPDTAAISSTIDSLMQAFSAAIAAKDTDAVVGTYADDAMVLPDNHGRADGKEAIRKLWVGLLSAPGVKLTVTPGPKTISQSGDLVVDVGTYDYTAASPKGKPVHDVGKTVGVFKQVGGQWKLQIDTWNSDLPMPGQGK